MAKDKPPKAIPKQKKPKGKEPDEVIIKDGKDNPRKLAFARKYVELGQAIAAYYAAGYTGPAEKKAYTLLKDKVVRVEIERLYRELDIETIVTAKYVISNIRRAADITGQVRFSPVLGTLDMLDVSSHLRANEMLGKYLGLFRERVEVKTSIIDLLNTAPDPIPSAEI